MYRELAGGAKYEAMIAEAKAAPADWGVTVDPNMLVGKGAIANLSLDVDRGTLFRATTVGLAGRLKHRLGVLETVGGFRRTS